MLAVEVAGEVATYRRASTAAHRAYLAAGAMLVEAREAAKRGEWAPFLAACGDELDERTAQRMMQLARSGMTAADVTAAGGIRGALESLAAPRNPSPVTGNGTPAPDPESATVAGIEAPEPGKPRAQSPTSPVAAGEPLSVQAGEPAPGMSLYAWRRARGLCTSCGAPADGRARCSGCAGKLNRKRRSRTRIAGELVTRIEAAAQSGEGLSLTPAGVARLAGGGPPAERCGGPSTG